ncbi:MAG: hypothetical protein M1608_00235 [Candidatus Omnitrophica bacterium]|nr:hypothetical protein [Candidatus Omnitrophota bacterium]
MKKNTIITLVAAALLAGALWSIYSTQFKRGPKLNLKPYEALGEVSADETARIMGKPGGVAIVAEDFGKYTMSWSEVLLAAFQKGLSKHAGISVVLTEKFTDPTISSYMATGLSPDRLLKIIQGHPDLNALVLFGAFPPLTDAEMNGIRQRGVGILVVSDYKPHYRGLLRLGIIKEVISPRLDSASGTAKTPGTMRDWFDQSYVIYTPQNAPSPLYY